ncbi:MAG: GTP cyclohydrolase II [Thermoplasmata archaeon]|nr:GTP cyclohydrolase II [Thermoplasmata archaeon]
MRVVAVADLPTRFGEFEVVSFRTPGDGKDHAALVLGDIGGKENVPVRLHSECLTGDVFASLRCDCREQLELAIEEILARGSGALLYLRQEGRGIGLENKIKAYRLQELGLDTIEANEALGFRADERDYLVAAEMLRALDVRSILLMSNNPAKINDLQAHGVRIAGRIPLEVSPNPHNAKYLETKRVRAGHLLKEPPWPPMREQIDCLHSSTGPSEG